MVFSAKGFPFLQDLQDLQDNFSWRGLQARITLFFYYCLLNPGTRIQKTHNPPGGGAGGFGTAPPLELHGG